jgi:hypothetical protein
MSEGADPFRAGVTDCVLLIQRATPDQPARPVGAVLLGLQPDNQRRVEFCPPSTAPVKFVSDVAMTIGMLFGQGKFGPNHGSFESPLAFYVYWRDFARRVGLDADLVALNAPIAVVSEYDFEELLAAAETRDVTGPVTLTMPTEDWGFEL